MGAEALHEESPLNPVSLYARTKIASERIVLEMGDDYFCPTVLRMGTLYGYSPRMRFDLVVNTMAMKAFTERRIQVFGGRQWRPLLNVEDAADVYAACLEADLKDVGNQVFNVGSDEQNYRIEQIAGIVSDCLGGVRIRARRVESGHARLPRLVCENPSGRGVPASPNGRGVGAGHPWQAR